MTHCATYLRRKIGHSSITENDPYASEYIFHRPTKSFFFFHRDTVFLQMVKSFSTENDPYVLKLIFDLPTKYIFFIMTRLCDSLRDNVKEWSNVLLQKMIPIS